MEFMSSRPDIVRSQDQRWLLGYWNRLRADAALPVWPGLSADTIAISGDSLSQTDVVGQTGSERFLIQFHGWRLAEAYGRISCVGKFLDEVLPDAYRESALSTYRHLVREKLPIYTVSDMRDGAGRIVHYERLLLPFCDGGPEVTRILASLETTSPEGDFDNANLMTAPGRPPTFALCTTIQY
jgi:hypothetical protein